MGSISLKLFWIWTSGSRDVKAIFYLELWRPLCSSEQNRLCNFRRGHYQVHISEIILNLVQWFRRCRWKDLAALMFSRAETFGQFWLRALWGTFVWNYFKFGPVVQEEMLLKEKVYTQTMDIIEFIELVAKKWQNADLESCILSLFPNLFNKFNKTWAHM